MKTRVSSRGAQIPAARSPRRLKFCTVAPDMCVSSVWNLLHVSLTAPRIMRWIPVSERFVHPYVKLVRCEAVTPTSVEFFALWGV